MATMKLSMRHDLPCTPDEFWAAFLDEEQIVAMYTEALGATSAEVVEQSGDVSSGVTRTLHSEQPIDAPGPIRKLMGDTAGTTETGTYDPGTATWTFSMEPSTLADKIHLAGTIRVDETDGGCVRVFDLEGKVKILGLGKVFEAFIESQTKDAQDRTAEFWRARLG